ncbi:MAG TPA: hypothetical protein VMU24_09965 [Candidatus Acidoferrales bacterium]|nr:hypothetical protein [Candidatus Acidoferrales bacterium]
MKKLLLAITLAAAFATVLHAQDADDRMKQHAQAEKITHGPVVETVGRDYAVVAWSTNTGGSSVVR